MENPGKTKTTIMEKPESPQKFSAYVAEAYGPPGSLGYADFQAKTRTFQLGRKIQEIRLAKQMTQTELAERIGTQKSYISRIENGADLHVSSLFKIFEHGLETPLHLIAGDLLS